MSLIRIVAAGALVLTVFASGLAVAAQGGPGRGLRGGGPAAGRGEGVPYRLLDLSDAQQQQMREIRERYQDEIRQAEERVRAAMTAQRQAVEAVPFNESAIRATTQIVAEAQTEAAIVQAKVHSESWAILTVEQQTQAQALAAQRDTGARPREQPQRRGSRR